MPGIYINDGGGLQQSLGNVLGGLATAAGPQAQAEALLNRYRTEGQDISNQQALEILRARQANEASAGDLLGTFGANAPGPSGVASTTASLALPPGPPMPSPVPGGRTSVDLSGLTPIARFAAGRIAQGDFSPAELATTTGLGQQAIGGPGSDYTTQGEIAKAKAVPYDLPTGVEHHVPGGAGPETIVTSQQDPATLEAERQQRGLDVADAERRAQLGENAGKSSQEVTRLRDIYNTLVAPGAADDALATWSDEALRFASQATGFPFTKASSRIDAINAIKSRMAALAGNAAQTIQAGTPIRGILDNANRTLADPEANADQFNSAVDQMLRGYKSQVEAKTAADAFRSSRYTKADADAYRAALAAQTTREADEFKTEQNAKPPAAAPATSAVPANAPKPPTLQPADGQTVQRARVKLKQANNDPAVRQRIIDAGRANGVDLVAGGF